MVAATGYRVLARTYRPKTFATLIGQEVMVQTLANAIALNRLPHAIMLTGVRGVGKTTTARLIAKALNCVGADGTGSATIDPCGVCEHCVGISEDRHLDVQEIDAASHTKVEEIRKIFDGVAYQPVAARYRIYIVDEVHMLSGHSFNALLKTLEEPPPHVKFLFATTEIRKVPVTILSRCMRFSLRRVEVPVLAAHLQDVAFKEQVGLEPSAATLLAKAAEGSVRDSLSLLDQAIALSSTDTGVATINDAVVRQMLGLAAGDGVQQVLAAILQGQPDLALTHFGQLYAAGSEPMQLLQDLLHLVYQLTRAQLMTTAEEGGAASEDLPPLLPILTDLAAMPLLTRAWQMLLKGIDEVQQAPNAFEAAEMILVRLAYASTLPTPYELMRGQLLQVPSPAAAPAPTAKAARAPYESAATPAVTEVASVASDTASATALTTVTPLEADPRPPA
ncbi:MAG: DNA polymerase III subunit gamma/tau, partial [Alphaproteobacteria bacterium]|nr:DNA polymerase III subunit gamma/tau [Alphaproteobacteria bacterium]